METAARRAWRRVEAGWWPVALASLAAALAWLIAHRLLGHPRPFFAPIAGAIALSTSRIQRSRRIVQMVSGVLLGIVIGELLGSAFGASTVTLGAIVFVTLTVALLAGGGFFSEGMMFANQAAASAILVVTLRGQGAGGERAVDVLVGGGVALVLGVVLFPAQPLTILRDAESSVLRTLARTLQEVGELLAAGERPEDGWTLRRGYEIHQQLGALARARATARANVRIAPRRWRLRTAVDSENQRTAQLDLLANAVLGLVRAATDEREGQLSAPLRHQIVALGDAMQRLASTPQPWAAEFREELGRLAAGHLERANALGPSQGKVVATILGHAADDLSRVIELRAPPGAASHRTT